MELIKGESCTIGFIFNAEYNTANIRSFTVNIGREVFTPVLVSGVYRLEISSERSKRMAGDLPVIVNLDDVNFGVRKEEVRRLTIVSSYSNFANSSNDLGLTYTVRLTVDGSYITSDVVLLQGIKGDKGDPGEKGEKGDPGSGGGGGHTILNEAGDSMAQRAKLQFVGATVTDDAGNDTTEVEIHTHSNKSILDQISAAFTTALKSAYDGAVTWISTNGSTLLNNTHIHSNKTTIDKFAWNEQDSTIEFALDGSSVLQIGQEEVIRIYNNTGSNLTDGQVVYINGSSGTRPTVALATNATEIGSENTIGVVTQPILAGAEGFVTTSGLVRGIDTNSFLAGDILYLGVNGAITKTKPVAPNHAVKIGYCVKKAGVSDGIILVKVDSGYELSELHDVDTTKSKDTPVDADAILLQDSADSSIWKRLTFSNLKTTLKTYFDTIYTTTSAVASQISTALSSYATTASVALKRDKTEIGDAHGWVSPPNADNFTISNTGSSVTVTVLIGAGAFKINGTDFTARQMSINFTASLGQNFISCYLNAGVPTLQASTGTWDIMNLTAIPVCTVNWDGTNVRLSDELHLSNRNLIEHKKQHDTDGARYVSGFATTFGSSANNTFSSALGVIRDEERYHNIAAKTNAQIVYRNSALTAMIFDAASTTYAKLNGAIPRYDNNGVLTDIATGSYGISWMYASNAKLPVNSEIVFVLGQGIYSSIANAQAASQPTLVGMSVAEWKLLYRVIYRNVGGALLFTQADDLRLTTTGLAVSGSGVTSVSAGNVIVSPINGITSTNGQGAIEELALQAFPNSATIAGQFAGSTTIPANVPQIYADAQLTNTVTVSLGTPVANAINRYTLIFSTGATKPTITWPTGTNIKWAYGVDLSASNMGLNKKYIVQFLYESATVITIRYDEF